VISKRGLVGENNDLGHFAVSETPTGLNSVMEAQLQRLSIASRTPPASGLFANNIAGGGGVVAGHHQHQTTSSTTNNQQQPRRDVNYINVNQMPVAYASRAATKAASAAKQGDVNVQIQQAMHRKGQGMPTHKPTTVPAIPRSQVVKQRMEPSYSMMLQPETQQAPAQTTTNAVQQLKNQQQLQQQLLQQQQLQKQQESMQQQQNQQPIYANTTNSVYSHYSELEALRSTDSQCSNEQEPFPDGGPPSPVSSSYSELRQATNRRMPTYQPGGADSVYEPVGVRAKTVSVGATLASPYAVGNIGGTQGGGRGGTVNNRRPRSSLDRLGPGTGDYFGLCTKCNMKIIGDGTGCTAMGRLYHVDCFTCTACHCLLQGKPFYALDGKPYCEEDYLQTLEKCCKCQKPILERILRATGKPYHPQCFTCVMCNKSLDGVPFTVDATNQIHCIEDFHRRFAPRCSVCKHPIMPESGNQETVRVVALDRSFHVNCYKCEDCGLLLSSEEEGRGCYPLDDHVLCKQCNTRRIQLLTQRI